MGKKVENVEWFPFFPYRRCRRNEYREEESDGYDNQRGKFKALIKSRSCRFKKKKISSLRKNSKKFSWTFPGFVGKKKREK